MELKLIDIKNETGKIKTFRFEKKFDYVPGQFVMLQAKIADELVKRAYSIASSPSDRFLELSIEHFEGGKLSTYMHKEAKVGDTFDISEPMGKFILGEEQKVVMIAGGSGVVPFRSMIREEVSKCSNREFVLFLSAKTRDHLLYNEELLELAESNHNLRVILTITREKPENWKGMTGRITIDTMKETIGQFRDYAYFICGSNEFVMAFSDLLKPLGVKIRKELWG